MVVFREIDAKTVNTFIEVNMSASFNLCLNVLVMEKLSILLKIVTRVESFMYVAVIEEAHHGASFSDPQTFSAKTEHDLLPDFRREHENSKFYSFDICPLKIMLVSKWSDWRF